MILGVGVGLDFGGWLCTVARLCGFWGLVVCGGLAVRVWWSVLAHLLVVDCVRWFGCGWFC